MNVKIHIWLKQIFGGSVTLISSNIINLIPPFASRVVARGWPLNIRHGRPRAERNYLEKSQGLGRRAVTPNQIPLEVLGAQHSCI